MLVAELKDNSKVIIKHWDGGKIYITLNDKGRIVQTEKEYIKRSFFKSGFNKFLLKTRFFNFKIYKFMKKLYEKITDYILFLILLLSLFCIAWGVGGLLVLIFSN